ncbi:salivary secreted peptide [Apis cerana cerana]|uniref:Salivary secreted peptide n=1 Tax=Apis cerana cerana TaxID=94128 RepID=A0A2A3ES69_APICC|nr:salivary secreted peptide [Apis cerana cerana]
MKTIVFLPITALAISLLIAVQVNSAPQSNFYGSNNNKSHDLVIGYRMPGDRLILRQSIIKNSSWGRIVTDERTFNTTRFERITQVRVLDQKTNGNGAYASILFGGPGWNNVTIRFKSQRGHGINFIVEVYSRP